MTSWRLWGEAQNRRSIWLPNGPRISTALSDERKGHRSSKVSMLVIYEAARASDELYHAMGPDAGGGWRGLVADEQAEREARVFLRR